MFFQVALFVLTAVLSVGFAKETAPLNFVYPSPSSRVALLRESPRIYLIEKFLSDEECDYLVASARPELERSTVVSSGLDPTGEIDEVHEARTSYGMFFPHVHSDPILGKIEERIAKLTRIPVQNGEAMQVLKYERGQEYQPHFDFFDEDTPGGVSCYNRGGQRIATLIMYLANTEEGGETIFPEAKIKVKPIKGNAVLFYNCKSNGTEDPLTLHGGAPVIRGEKWIATKWIRKGAFK